MVLSMCACCTRSNPIYRDVDRRYQQIIKQVINQGGKQFEKEPRYYCGEDLALALRNTCSLFHGLFDEIDISGGIIAE